MELSFFFFLFPLKKGEGGRKGNKKDIVWLDWTRLKGFGMPMQWNDQADARVCFPPREPLGCVWRVLFWEFHFFFFQEITVRVLYCAWHTHTPSTLIERGEVLESGQKSKSKADMASMLRRFVVHGACLLQLFANVLKHHVVKLDYQRLAQAMGDSSSLLLPLIHSINSLHRRDSKSNIPPDRQDQRKGSSTPQ